MNIFLQLWGGIFYLLNKVFLSVAEGSKNKKTKKKLKIYGWIVYIMGVPAWIIIMSLKQDWIIASIEVGAIPSMILGFLYASKGDDYSLKWLEKLSKICVYSFVAIGIVYSIYHFNGITTLSQVLEIGVIIGFLIGTDLLAKKKSSGWLWFILMNTSMIILMFIQDKPYLAVQQILSIGFVINGFIQFKLREIKT